MTALKDLKGVGPALEKALKDQGITSVEALAAISEKDLSKVPGIGAARAARLKQAAVAPQAGAVPVQPRPTAPVRTGRPAARPTKVTRDVPPEDATQLNAALAAAEAARLAAEEKAAKAKIKARKAAKKAEALALEMAEARVKAKEKAKRVKAKARKAIEREKAKAEAILARKKSGGKLDASDKATKEKPGKEKPGKAKAEKAKPAKDKTAKAKKSKKTKG